MAVVTGTFCLSTVLSLLQHSVWIFSSNSSPVKGLLDCYRNTSCNCTLIWVWSLYRLGCILACLLAFQESLSFCFFLFCFCRFGKGECEKPETRSFQRASHSTCSLQFSPLTFAHFINAQKWLLLFSSRLKLWQQQLPSEKPSVVALSRTNTWVSK